MRFIFLADVALASRRQYRGIRPSGFSERGRCDVERYVFKTGSIFNQLRGPGTTTAVATTGWQSVCVLL
jgi:hypothetical protein